MEWKTAASLLDDLASRYKGLKTQGRDGFLEAGKMLQLYILKKASEVEHLSNTQRASILATREKWITLAEIRLGETKTHINKMIRVSAVVTTLGHGVDLGDTPIATIVPLSPLIERPNILDKDLTLSQKMTWRPNPLVGRKRACDLFVQAVTERWTKREAELHIAEAFGRQKKGSMENQKESISVKVKAKEVEKLSRQELLAPREVDYKEVAKSATPHDLADMIVEIIFSSPRPSEVSRFIMGTISEMANV